MKTWFLKRGVALVSVLCLGTIGVVAYNVTATAEPDKGADANSPAGIQWSTDLNEGLAQAKNSDKPVLVDVSTSWCGWCKKMDKDTYTNQAVIKLLNSRFVCVKLDGDSKQGRKFVRTSGIDGFPTVVVINAATGKAIKNAGYLDAANFLSAVAEMEKQVTSSGGQKRELAEVRSNLASA